MVRTQNTPLINHLGEYLQPLEEKTIYIFLDTLLSFQLYLLLIVLEYEKLTLNAFIDKG